jgi:hypothetical protein
MHGALDMPRWTRFLSRIRTRRLHPGDHLHVCRECAGSFAYPVTWAESGPDHWWLLLRCGACGAWREATSTNASVAEFDCFLDAGTASITKELERLERNLLRADAETFGKALKLDLLTADDFRAGT